MITDIKWLLFDFGGCLDSDGMHSRTIFFHFFKQLELVDNEEWALFQDAYTFADKRVIGESLIVDATLAQMNLVMSQMIQEHLQRASEGQIIEVAAKITSFQEEYLTRNRGLLLNLAKKYKLGIISNFSGNLEVILKEYQLLELFEFVLDSYHVGCSKPDSKIFKQAIERTGVESQEICYLGDNAIRDMIPAKKLKMKTIHVLNSDEPRIKSKNCSPDAVVSSLTEVCSLVCPAQHL